MSHCGETAEPECGAKRIALIGAPNAGKTTIFNSLTGLRSKTANYPGVTVTRREARLSTGDDVLVDLPGTYSLDPISPDEKVVVDALRDDEAPDAIVVVADATSLGRSLIVVGQALALDLPTALVLTMMDEVEARGGEVDVERLESALGVPVVATVASRGKGLDDLSELLAAPERWPRPLLAPPADDAGRADWVDSIVEAVETTKPHEHRPTSRIDAVLLHPLWGTLVFVAVMVAFFQIIFTLATPLQGYVTAFFDQLAQWTTAAFGTGWFSDFVTVGVIGGVGTVLQFLPQIILLFLAIAFLENVGYMSRAAFVIDKVMYRFGLEGRSFVSMLSSYACAVPGIMSTRSIPSSKDRISTIMAAPLMTCSARLPVYTLLIAAFVPNTAVFGPLRLQGLVMLGLYVLGSVSAMLAAAVFGRSGRKSDSAPFYMEMAPYRLPTLKLIGSQVWDSGRHFVRKTGTIILGVSIVIYILLSVPAVTAPAYMTQAQATQYQMEHSIAGTIGRAVEPIFAPLGFNWEINVALIGSLGARETFVSTLGQTTAAGNPDSDSSIQSQLKAQTDPVTGVPVFDAATVAALLLFFVYAMQCMSTMAAIRRETNSYRWPAVAFGYMFALAWVAGFIGHLLFSI